MMASDIFKENFEDSQNISLRIKIYVAELEQQPKEKKLQNF